MRIIIRFHYARLLKYTIFVSLSLCLVLVAVFLYFYVNYSSRIDRAFQDRPWEKGPILTSAPTLIFPGQILTRDDLVEMLRQRGYVLSAFPDKPPAYSVSTDPATLVVTNARNWSTGRGHHPLRVTIRFSPAGIVDIRDTSRHQALNRFYIRPAELSAQRSGQRRKQVTFRELPSNLVYAVLAAEDQRFFDHPGVDLPGILRSLWRNLREDRIMQGGSTITQQLAKNIFLTPERTLSRKIREAFFSLILESRLSKEKLFEIYANVAYLGQCANFSIYGFAEAADIYCNKSVRNLSLSECALLAGMIRSPNRYHPFRHPQEAMIRRNQVLEAMVRAGFISANEQQAAAAMPVPAPESDFFRELRGPYFLDYAAGVFRQPHWRQAIPPGTVVHTSLNLEIQSAAEEAVREALPAIQERIHRDNPGEPADQLQAAMVVLAPRTGEVLAMVGGRDYLESQYNRAVSAHRQAGSLLKPFLYARMLDAGHTTPSLDLRACAPIVDRPVTIRYGRRRYHPHNYRNIYHGPVIMKTALTHSLNVPTVLFAQRVGFKAMAEFVNRLGFAARAVPYPSVALGTVDVSPLEMASAYTAFYSRGHRRPPQAIDRSLTTLGPPSPPPVQLFSPGAAFIVTDMLKDVVNEGTATNIRREGLDLIMAGKTGTAKDGWFVGLTGNLICCAWVGYDENRELPLSGGQSALFLFTALVQKLRGIYPVEDLKLPEPTGLVARTVCLESGKLATPRCPHTTRVYLFRNTDMLSSCHIHQ